MKEIIEVRNETNTKILASACRSRLSGRLYVHVGLPDGTEINPHYYALVEVKEVES